MLFHLAAAGYGGFDLERGGTIEVVAQRRARQSVFKKKSGFVSFAFIRSFWGCRVAGPASHTPVGWKARCRFHSLATLLSSENSLFCNLISLLQPDISFAT